MKKTRKESAKPGKSERSARPTLAERTQPAPSMDAPRQTQLFEGAVKSFHARDFRKAQALFEEAAAGPSRAMAHSARLHARICHQRLAKPQLRLETAEDHYNYAISLINQGQLELAGEHLGKALQKLPGADYIHYAMALARGLSGDMQRAAEHMKRAIELQPRNRGLARNDPDFDEIAQRSPMRELLFPERTRSA